MFKPIVHYSDVGAVTVGEVCFLAPTDHPSSYVSNTTYVRTSRVVAYDAEFGRIETKNTIYIKV